MIIAKSSMRISLVGGSTDLETFISSYGRGEVISFPSTLGCYVSIHDNNRNKYIINYSNPETCDSLEEVKNDVAREVLRHFNCPPVTLTFNCDILGTGSGLASSSAYTCAAIACIGKYMGIELDELEVASIALKIERLFNPLVGRQDPYGCCVSGFKRLVFHSDGQNEIKLIDSRFLDERYDMFLTPAGQFRSSSSILATLKPESSLPLLNDVQSLQDSIDAGNQLLFEEVMKSAWEKKKSSSSLIVNPEIDSVERELRSDGSRALKLCGAGSGGYVLSFFEKGKSPTGRVFLRASIADEALKVRVL